MLAVLVALGSVGWYGLAWMFPALSRRYDVVLAGAGLFYGLVLWVCAGKVTGAIALGQLAILGLLGALGYQVLQLRGGATEEMAALPQGAGVMALVGAVRSRVTGLKAAPLQLKLTGSAEEGTETEKEKQKTREAIAAPDTEAQSTETKATETAETPELQADVDVTPTKTAKSKAAKPKKASQPVATGKGVYQRKKVRKFDRGEGKTGAKPSGQPVYQRKKVRKFEVEGGSRDKQETTAKTESNKSAAKAKPDVAPPEKVTERSKATEVRQVSSVAAPKVKSAAIATDLVIDIDGDFWEMVAIAPDIVLIPDNDTVSKTPIPEDPWTTPPMDPEELTLGIGQKIAAETVKEIAAEAAQRKSPDPQPKKTKAKQPVRRPSTPSTDSNWPDDNADSNWPNDADSNWPDDDADSNWPDESPKRTKPKPRKRPKPSVPVVEGEVVSRSPHRPVILDAELIRDDD
ncbi:MAG: Ycf66 family protein [Cyanobacteria bacterium P01_F01_bin.153]